MLHRTAPCAIAALLAVSAAAMGQGRLVAIDSSRRLYEIDMKTGETVQFGTVSSNAGVTGGLTRDPVSGTIYLTSSGNDSVYTLDLTTFAATLIGPYGDPNLVMHGLEYVDGRLYGGSTGNLHDISLTTGAATQIGATGLTDFLNLGYDSTAGIMYGTNSVNDDLHIINLQTGSATIVGPLNGPTNPHGLAFNTDNGRMYLVCSATDMLYTIDTNTGAATAIGFTGSGNLLGLVYIPDAAPPVCYANCDGSTVEPVLNVSDFICFQTKFAAEDPDANCDGSTTPPVLNVSDFICFQTKFSAGCS